MKHNVELYHKLESSGLLTKSRLRVLAMICLNPKSTASELFSKQLGKKAPSQIRARLNELREQGVIYEYEIRKCSITQNKAISWDLTGNMPQAYYPTPKLRKNTLKRAIKHICDVMDERSIMFLTKEELLNLDI